jgi:hypothetical protein
MAIVNCGQCGKTFDTNRGGVTDITVRMGTFICSSGCLKAYKQQNNLIHPVDAVLGLAGKAIGGAINGVNARKQERSAQEVEENASRKQQRRAERQMQEEEDESRRATKIDDRRAKEDHLCSRCRYYKSLGQRRLQRFIWILIPVLGLYSSGFILWPNRIWAIIGGILALIAVAFLAFILIFEIHQGRCKSQDACSASNETDPQQINPNLRCKYWEKRK